MRRRFQVRQLPGACWDPRSGRDFPVARGRPGEAQRLLNKARADRTRSSRGSMSTFGRECTPSLERHGPRQSRCDEIIVV